MRTATAFAPGNLSCVFVPYNGKTLSTTGSLGVGFTVKEGAFAKVDESKKTIVRTNGKKTAFPTVMSVVKRLSRSPIAVEIKSTVPFGCGFGMSGASALACAYAINDFLHLNKTKKELALIAHMSEVENGTGLGDVCNQHLGGFRIKLKKGKPLVGKKLTVKEKIIYYKAFGEISTKKIIKEKRYREQIKRSGNVALKKIRSLKNPSLKEVFDISCHFAQESGLLRDKKVIKTIHSIQKRGGFASMIMLGNSVMSTIPFTGCKKTTITTKGAYSL
jgi:pantoate kinase